MTITNQLDFQLVLGETCEDQPLADVLSKMHAVLSSRMAAGSPATLADYEIQLRHLQRFFDGELRERKRKPRPVRLSDVSSQLLARAMKAMLERGRSVCTANKLRRSIYAIYNTALACGWAGKPLRVRAYPEPKRKPEAWLVSEFQQLLTAAASMPHTVTGDVPTSDFFVALLLVLFNTGSRIDAIMRCPVEGCLDLDRAYLCIPAELQKHYADEPFELLPQTVAALQRLRVVERKLPTIFADWRWDRRRRAGDGPGRWMMLLRRLQELVVAAGLAHEGESLRLKSFHRLRRTFASYVAASSGRAVACEMLGHSSMSVTMRYLDPRIVGDRRVVGKLPDVVCPADILPATIATPPRPAPQSVAPQLKVTPAAPPALEPLDALAWL